MSGPFQIVLFQSVTKTRWYARINGRAEYGDGETKAEAVACLITRYPEMFSVSGFEVVAMERSRPTQRLVSST